MLELARPEDWEAFDRIDGQCHALHVAWRPDIYKTDELNPETLYLEAIRERRYYVAKLHGAVVGIVTIHIRPFSGPGIVERKTMLVDHFAVEESCRGQGIGSAMLADVFALAKAFGCTDIQLNVLPQNEAAIALYQKFGFGIRSITMQRKL